MKRLVLSLVLALTCVSTALAATSGSPGKWTRVTEPGSNTDEVGASRTPDQVLHVVWRKKVGDKQEALLHASISPVGKVGAAKTALTLESVGNPDLVTLPDGKLRMVFPALGSTTEDGGIKAATAPASGATWVRDGLRISESVSALEAPGAGLTRDGDLVFAYTKTGTLAFHVGLDPAVKDTPVQANTQCCDYQAEVATDASTGETYLAWFSNAKGRTGVWARRILPAVGAPAQAPGSSTGGSAAGVDQRSALTARIGAPGVYMATCKGYPSCTQVMLWRVGGAAQPVAKTKAAEDINIAAGPEGRLWVMWDEGSPRTIFAARTNKAATKLGPVQQVTPPAGTDAIWKLKGEGSLGPLDLLANVRQGTPQATWHTQVWPPLALSARARTVRGEDGKDRREVVFSVTDVGDPVPGARIAFGGRTLTTDAGGKAVVATAAAGKATATKQWYTAATATVAG